MPICTAPAGRFSLRDRKKVEAVKKFGSFVLFNSNGDPEGLEKDEIENFKDLLEGTKETKVKDRSGLKRTTQSKLRLSLVEGSEPEEDEDFGAPR